MTSNSRRLITDTARRMWGAYAIQIGLVFLLSLVAKAALRDGVVLASTTHIFAWTMASCWFLAFTPALLLETREITRLPVSRREFWIAHWWLAVAFPPVGVAIAILLGTAITATSIVSVELAALTLVYCTLYGGVYIALTALFPTMTTGSVGAWQVATILFRVLVIPLGGAALPLWFGKYLPHTFAGLTGPALGFVVAAAGVTAASYFFQPSITERPSRSNLQSKRLKVLAGGPAPSRLSGVAHLLMQEARRSLAFYVALLALVVGFWVVFGSGTLAEFFRAGNALVFFAPVSTPTGGFSSMIVMLGIGMSDIGLLGDMRGLRALPMSRSRLAAILTGLGVISAAMMWIVLVAAHILAIGPAIESLRPELFALMAGSMALSGSVRLSLLGNQFVRILSTIVFMTPVIVGFGLLSGREPLYFRAAIITGGGAALLISWWLNQRTLGRSHRVYKQPAKQMKFTFS